MSKLKAPLLGLGAHGSLGDTITYQARQHGTMVRLKPHPLDPYTLAQCYQRWDYQDYADQWHALTPAQQQAYESLARRRRITGFNYFLSEKLLTLPDLVGRWHLDCAPAGLTPDSSKNNNPGTVFGAIFEPFLISNGAHFDGVDDYITMGDLPLFDLTDVVSVECLFSLLEPTVQTIVVGKITPWSAGYALWWTNPTRLTFVIITTAGVTDLSTGFLTLNQPYHAVGTYDKDGGANNMKLLIDGVISAQRTWTGAIIPAVTDFRLGRWNAWGTHECLIDEVRLYNRILTSSDALRHAGRRYPV